MRVLRIHLTSSYMKDLTGRVFGRLTVIEVAGKDNSRHVLWRCSCSCGKESMAAGSDLTRGARTSCGCLQKLAAITHNCRYIKPYKKWGDMKQRCLNPRCPGWKSYGGLGVKVC